MKPRYFRFLSTMAELSPPMLAHFTQIDYEREMAIVAVIHDDADGERIIGVVRYLLNPDAGTAEFSLVVADAYQVQGIGSAPMRRLGFIGRGDPDDPDLRRVVMKP